MERREKRVAGGGASSHTDEVCETIGMYAM